MFIEPMIHEINYIKSNERPREEESRHSINVMTTFDKSFVANRLTFTSPLKLLNFHLWIFTIRMCFHHHYFTVEFSWSIICFLREKLKFTLHIDVFFRNWTLSSDPQTDCIGSSRAYE